jgi:cobalt-zinc-cadmium efflux system outer membrane protein
MQISGFQLLQAKRDEIETAKVYLEAVRDYWLARAELEEILAGRFIKSERPLFTPTMEIKRAPMTGDH